MIRWRTKEATANFPTPAILFFCGYCVAFAGGNNPTKICRKLNCILEVFKIATRLYRLKLDDETLLRINGIFSSVTCTIKILRLVGIGNRRLNSNGYTTGSSLEINFNNALISVSCLAMANGDAIGYNRSKSTIVDVWLSNQFDQTLAIFKCKHHGKNMPSKLVKHGVKLQFVREMQTAILSMLGPC